MWTTLGAREEPLAQNGREPGLPDLLVRLRDRVVHAPERGLPGVEVEQEPGGAGVAVAGLADRARVQQPAVVPERDLGPGRRVTAPELAVVDRHRQRNVAVADEHQRRRGLFERTGGRLV